MKSEYQLRREKIDELRALLDLYDRSTVSVVALNGTIETTDDRSSIRTFDDSGDRAYVFVGPSDKLQGERHEAEDGSIMYTIVLQRPQTSQ